MQTDQTTKDQIRIERKRVFWRLYTVPYLIIVIIFIGISAFLFNQNLRLQNSIVSQTEKIRTEEQQNANTVVTKTMRNELVKRGLGKWEVDWEGNIHFEFIEKPEIIAQPEPQIRQREFIPEIKPEPEIIITPQDIKNIESIYDVEKELTKELEIIYKALLEKHKLNNSQLEDELISNSQETIKRTFKGIKTYRKVNEE